LTVYILEERAAEGSYYSKTGIGHRIGHIDWPQILTDQYQVHLTFTPQGYYDSLRTLFTAQLIQAHIRKWLITLMSVLSCDQDDVIKPYSMDRHHFYTRLFLQERDDIMQKLSLTVGKAVKFGGPRRTLTVLV
jgi:hypothetical protein